MTTFKTPQEYFKLSTDFLAGLPKTQAEAKDLFQKVQTTFSEDMADNQAMWRIYQKATTGDATTNEISKANKTATELLKASSFATLVAMPGSVFLLPLLIDKAKEHGIDLIPKSMATMFNT